MIFILIKNEIRKLLSRRKTLVMLIAFILLTALIGYSSYRNYEANKRFNSPEFRLQNDQEALANIKDVKAKISKDAENSATSADSKIKINQQIEDMNVEIARLEKEIDSLKTYNKTDVNWKEQLKQTIDAKEKELAAQSSPSGELLNKGSGELQDSLKEDKYLYENNIKPRDPFALDASTFIQDLIGSLGAIFLVVGVVVFSSDMVSGECTPATLKFLLIQPVSRAKVLFSKFVAIVCSTVVLILFVEIMSYIVMGLIFGFGNSNYPVRVGTRFQFDMTSVVNSGHPLVAIPGSSHIIPEWKYILDLFGLQILYIVACAAFTFLISTLFKSSMISMAVGIVSVIVLTILVGVFGRTLGSIMPLLFVAYGGVDGVISGRNLPMMFNNPSITIGFCIWVLIGWTVVSYLLAHVIFKKRDILI